MYFFQPWNGYHAVPEMGKGRSVYVHTCVRVCKSVVLECACVQERERMSADQNKPASAQNHVREKTTDQHY